MDVLTFVLSAKGIEAQGDPATLWERFLQILPLLFVGPVPRALALIAIVVGALMLYLDYCRQVRDKPRRACARTDSRRSTMPTRSLLRLDGD